MTAILGISAFFHDSAAAIVVDGRVVAAAQEERFSRKKHDHSLPVRAIEYCLTEAGIEPGQLSYVGFYEKPYLKFDRLLETYLTYAPRGLGSFLRSMPLWLKQKLFLPREIHQGLGGRFRRRIVFVEHHESHAASAFFPSPFEEAAILTLDAVGEWATASIGLGRGSRIRLLQEQRFPHSLGMLYSAFTYQAGFPVNSGEYKLMGLAPYGQPRYADLILRELVDLKEDGSLRLDLSFFNYCQGLTMTSPRFDRLFGGPPREPDSPLTEREMDLAASVQRVTEEVMLRCARHAHAQAGARDLCLAGGVALNCVGNGRILREGPFERIWIQPAAGDAGGALGVALFIWHQLLGNDRRPDPLDGQRASLLGPSFDDTAVERFLQEVGAGYARIDSDGELCEHVAGELARGKVVGWFQGRMEFGPRALGSRSILGDPRDPDMQAVMNLKVKFREGFRPFAPAVLEEHASRLFELGPAQASPYMLLVAAVRPEERRRLSEAESGLEGIAKLRARRSAIPAVTHVDYSARIQTVDPRRHGLYRRLIEAFYARTGCPVIVNTSFNLGWDPIVCTPREAYETFLSCGIDVLCMGHFVLGKAAQRAWVSTDESRPAAAAADGDGVLHDPVLRELICSPVGGGELRERGGRLVCAESGREFSVEGGIPRLFLPHDGFGGGSDVTERVKAFYEGTPFPDYEALDTVRSLMEKSRRGGYARRLDRAIPFNSTLLEVGCGTGQLANFLGVACRRVIGTDISMASLRLGEEFRVRHGLSRVRFVQMNLFRPCFKPGQFDVVLCNGVLHHTSDPFGGFRRLVPLVRPGGYIVIGLYNWYGRLATDLRRALFRLTGGRGKWLDPYLRSRPRDESKARAWYADQYRHPHETKHTIGEVLSWFARTGVAFVRGVPSVAPGDDEGDLFDPAPAGSRFDHLVSQLRQVGAGSREGGFFVMIGRRGEA